MQQLSSTGSSGKFGNQFGINSDELIPKLGGPRIPGRIIVRVHVGGTRRWNHVEGELHELCKIERVRKRIFKILKVN